PWLNVCKADYDAHEHPEQLHILDWQNDLPDIVADT
ncbi:unnamed protein product, partial [marine sediment metagenome]